MKKKYVITHVLIVIALGVSDGKADLLAYWGFNDPAATMAYDGVRGRHGRFHGGATTIGSRFGNALMLDGENSYVSIQNHRTFDVSKPFTVAVWAKVDSFNRGKQTIICKGRTSWTISRHDETNSICFTANDRSRSLEDEWTVVGDINVNDGKWHHIVAVYTVSQALLYTDGELAASAKVSEPIQEDNHNVCIGFDPEDRRKYWQGLVDDVLIFDHALSLSEVLSIYESGAERLVANRLGVLQGVVGKIDKLLQAQSSNRAISYINQKLKEYRRLQKKDPQEVSELHKRVLSDIYIRLAHAQVLHDTSLREVAETYQTLASLGLCSEHIVPALVWLQKNLPPRTNTDVIRTSIRNSGNLNLNLTPVAGDYLRLRDWPAFELFIQTILSDTSQANGYAWSLWQGLSPDARWGNRFLEYARDKPALSSFFKRARVQQAGQQIQQGNYQEAEHLYRDVLQQCKSAADKDLYDLKVCECLLKQGRYVEAIAALDTFMQTRKATQHILARKALLLKGRAYLQQDNIDDAYSTFHRYTIVCPNTEYSLEASFLTAYCQMLQERSQEAGAAFQMIVRDYPKSSYASLATLCLDRVNRRIHQQDIVAHE